jgi:branched-chain amino acid transport system substrate-binding protein
MKEKKWFGLVALFVVLVMLASACAPAPTPAPEMGEEAEATEEVAATEEVVPAEFSVVTVAPGDPIKVAVNVVTSGAGVDVLGLDELRATEIAVEDYGEVLGHTVEIVHNDTLCSAEGGQTASTKTVADPSIVAVVGHTCSSSCTPAATVYEQAGYTMVSPSCTAPSLTDPATHVGAFLRTAFNDLDQGPVAAAFAYNELGARKVATIHDGSPYAEQLAGVFADSFEGMGGEVVAREAINVGDTDMRPVLTTIAALEPDLIYAPIFPPEGPYIAVQRADVGLGEVDFMGADGLYASTYLEGAGDAAEGTYVSGPASASGPRYDAFLEKYLAAYGEEPPAPFHAHSYDAMTMILAAIEQVGVEGEDGTLTIDRGALRDALYATADFDGMTGMITCPEDGDCGVPLIAVLEVQNGEFVQVYTGGQE